MDPGLRESDPKLGRRQRTDGEPKGSRKGILIAGAMLLGLGIMANNWINPGFDFDDRPGMVDQDRARGPVTIEADELYEAFRDNPDGSRERFAGREMVVSGEFLRIVPDGYGSLDLRLRTSNPDEQLGIDLADLAVEDGKKLLPGQRVTVSCQGMGEGGDELWVRDCAIQPTAETSAAPAAPENASETASPPAENSSE
jgi:hypothetical protein